MLPLSLSAQSWDIVPDEGVFGVRWTASEAELIETLGEPNGYFELSRFRKMVYYGKSHSFLLINNQLKGYYFLEHNHSNMLNESVAKNQQFDQAVVTISGKSVFDESFEDVENLLDIELGEPDYRASFITDFVSVNLTFPSMTMGSTRSFRLGGVEIKYEL
tara:strand:+ start:26182 stop:26664 length:483 start_codon:yes stop_codon:yes gene_type:complete